MRQESDRLLWIDAAKLNEWKYFTGYIQGKISWPNRTFGVQNIEVTINTMGMLPHMQLRYITEQRHTREVEHHQYHIQLVGSPCHFGGKRWWFICPLVTNGVVCNRRVRKLYQGNKYFGCRSCQDLCYASQNENRRYSYARLFKVIEYGDKAEELREKIKVPYYEGRPTRKMRRYIELNRRSASNYYAWEKLDESFK